MKDHIIIIENNDGTGTPLSLDFSTYHECKAAIAWQEKGGFDTDNLHIMHKDQLDRENLVQGIFTDKAWNRFVNGLNDFLDDHIQFVHIGKETKQ